MTIDRAMTLRRMIYWGGRALNYKINWANGILLLGALAKVESNFGEFAVPRFERAYGWGGRYFDATLFKTWGDWAACSYSSFQIMYPVAVELGFRGTPADLHNDESAIHWVLEYIDKRILQHGCTSKEQFADAYNSGSFRDSNVPEAYIDKFVTAYNTIEEAYGLQV